MDEIWKPIEAYPYEVSNLERVRRVLKLGSWRIISQATCQKRRGRYAKVDLWRWNRRKTIYVHRLVAQAFLPPPAPHQHEVNHFDCNTLNNSADNLQWASRRENEQHKHFMRAFEGLPLVAAPGGSD